MEDKITYLFLDEYNEYVATERHPNDDDALKSAANWTKDLSFKINIWRSVGGSKHGAVWGASRPPKLAQKPGK
jgi:hypothetical protein